MEDLTKAFETNKVVVLACYAQSEHASGAMIHTLER